MNTLSVSDGFKFGCGFFLAALAAWMAVVVVGAILSLIVTAILGVSLGALFGGMDLSWVPDMLGFI